MAGVHARAYPGGEPNRDPSTDREAEAIFVVGVSRSGTTLMRRLLETSDRIAIAHENHFMGHHITREGARYYFRKLGDLHDDANVRRLVDFIYSGEFAHRSRLREPSHFWTWLRQNVPSTEFERRLLAEERTERGVLRAMMHAYADFYGRVVIGEKSPPHLWHVETLLEWFPDARVIHMMRDPRAIYVSEIRRRRSRPKKPYKWIMKMPLLLEAVMLWQTTFVWANAERRHRELSARYPDRYRLQRFEDLVTRPTSELRATFDFVGVRLPDDPVAVKVVSDGYRSGETGLDEHAADRWRDQIHPFVEMWLKRFLGGAMRRTGYPVDRVTTPVY